MDQCGLGGCTSPQRRNCPLHSPPHTPNKSWLTECDLPDGFIIPNWAHLRALLIDLEFETEEFRLRQLQSAQQATRVKQSVRCQFGTTEMVISPADSQLSVSFSHHLSN
jgi:hypothetical protein